VRFNQEVVLEEDESKDREEVDEDEGEDEGEDDGAQVARDRADHVLERLLPEDHFHQQDSIEEGMKYMAADAKDHEKDVVDQLPVLQDLQ